MRFTVNPAEWVRRFEDRAAAQRTREVNAQCRVDEVRVILRQGTAAERQNYLAATSAWREAGEPNVPLITEWYAQVPVADVEIGG